MLLNKTTTSTLISDEQIIEFDNLFHVGTMDSTKKGIVHKYSYEGDGLSVSLDPDQWTRIAKLGGLPTWNLNHQQPAKFLDFHSLIDDQIEVIKKWGEDLYTEVVCYNVQSYDENEDVYYLSFDTLAEAKDEAECLDPDAASARQAILKSTRIKASSLLKERVNIRDIDDALDFVILEYAKQAGFDGVWWTDEYGEYSCPRGVIFKNRVSNWRATVC